MSKTNEPRPIAYSPRAAAKVLGVGVTKLYSELGAGKIKAKKIGSRTIILHDDLMSYIASLPDMSGERAA